MSEAARDPAEMPDPIHSYVYADLIATFAKACTVELDGPAWDALFKFVTVAVVEGIARGSLSYWDYQHYLRCHFTNLARAVNRAASSGVATREMIITAGTAEVRARPNPCIGLAEGPPVVAFRVCEGYDERRITPAPPNACRPRPGGEAA